MTTKEVRSSLVVLGFLVSCSASALAAGEASGGTPIGRTKVTQAEAEKTALGKAPGGSIRSAELEEEGGRLIWSFDIAVPRSRNITEVQVDAKSGNVVSTQIETPADQAKEAQGDRAK